MSFKVILTLYHPRTLNSKQDNEDIHSLLALLRNPTTTPAPAQPPIIPSQSQLDNLLSSLSATAIPKKSAFDGPGRTRNTFEPFGPVGNIAGPSQTRISSSNDPRGSEQALPRSEEGVQRRLGRDDPGWREMGFAKALPILTGLLGDEGFMKEIKRVSGTIIYSWVSGVV